MDEYTPVYCCNGQCAQLQLHDWRGKPCQYCGGTTFATVRPDPTFSRIDKQVLQALDIPATDTKTKRKL